MSACKIVSNEGLIQEVKAPNGKPSLLYNKIVEATYGRNLQENLDNAVALEEYSKVYTKEFRDVFGNWENLGMLNYADFIDVERVTTIVDPETGSIFKSDLGNIRLRVKDPNNADTYYSDDSIDYSVMSDEDIQAIIDSIKLDILFGSDLFFDVYDSSSNSIVQSINIKLLDNKTAKISYSYFKTLVSSLKDVLLRVLKSLGITRIILDRKDNLYVNTGQGIGEAGYLLLADLLRSYGISLKSDNNRTPNANALWLKLVKKGLAKYNEYEDMYEMIPVEEIVLERENIGRVDVNSEPMLFTDETGYYYLAPGDQRIYVKRNDDTGKDIIQYAESVDDNVETDNTVNASPRMIKIILDNMSKIKRWESNSTISDELLRKKLGQLGIPSNQLELLIKSEGNSIEEKLTSFRSKYGYNVEIRVANKGKTVYSNLTVPGGINYTENEILVPGIRPAIQAHGVFVGDNGIGWFRSDDKIKEGTQNKKDTKEEGLRFIDIYDNINSYKGELNFNLKSITKEVVEYLDGPDLHVKVLHIKDKNNADRYFIFSEGQSGKELTSLEYNAKRKETYEGGEITKTRRILEVQSDLFQKGRDLKSLVDETSSISKDLYINEANRQDLLKYLTPFGETIDGRRVPDFVIDEETGDIYSYNYQGELYGKWPYTHISEFKGRQLNNSTKEEFLNAVDKYVGELTPYEYGSKVKDYVDRVYFNDKSNSNENQFLQLLNKDNNWVTFFIKSIIQDSAKKGYEKVLFPSGDTASKVEGHTTLEEFKKQKEDRIKELENKVAVETQPHMVVSFNREIDQLKQELERIEIEGFGALKPIYNFYENTVTNILKKQGYSPVLLTDEYENKWNEVSIKEQDAEEFSYYPDEDQTNISVVPKLEPSKYWDKKGNLITKEDIVSSEVIKKAETLQMFQDVDKLCPSGICNLTAKAATEHLQSIGLNPYPNPMGSELAVQVKSPLGPFDIYHYVSAVVINNGIYIYDMPQNEFISDEFFGKGSDVKLKGTFKPRLIPLNVDDISANYGLDTKDAARFVGKILNHRGSNLSPSFVDYLRNNLKDFDSQVEMFQEELAGIDYEVDNKLTRESIQEDKKRYTDSLLTRSLSNAEKVAVKNYYFNKIRLKTRQYLPRNKKEARLFEEIRNVLGDIDPSKIDFTSDLTTLDSLGKYMTSPNFVEDILDKHYNSYSRVEEINNVIGDMFSNKRLMNNFIRYMSIYGIEESLAKYDSSQQYTIKSLLPNSFSKDYKPSDREISELKRLWADNDKIVKMLGIRGASDYKSLMTMKYIANGKLKKYNTLVNYLKSSDYDVITLFEAIEQEYIRKSKYFREEGEEFSYYPEDDTSIKQGVDSVPQGFTRLYRSEDDTTGDGAIPDWIKDSDEYKAGEEAKGRWFYKTYEEAQYHANKFGSSGISYVDIPTNEVENYNAKDNKFAGGYGKEGREYFVSKEIASKRKPYVDQSQNVVGNNNISNSTMQPTKVYLSNSLVMLRDMGGNGKLYLEESPDKYAFSQIDNSLEDGITYYTVHGHRSMVEHLISVILSKNHNSNIISDENATGWEDLMERSIPYKGRRLYRPKYGSDNPKINYSLFQENDTLDILGALVKLSADHDPTVKQLSLILDKLLGDVELDTEIRILSDEKYIENYTVTGDESLSSVAGSYYHDLDIIDVSTINNYDNIGRIVLHEIIHALTVKKLKDGMNTSISFHNFYNRVKEILTDNNSPLVDSYGMSNVYEFIVAVFQDPELQKELSKYPPIRPTSDIRNLYDELISIIGKLIGLKSNEITLLHDSIDRAMSIIEATLDRVKSDKLIDDIFEEDPDYSFYPDIDEIEYSKETTTAQNRLIQKADVIDSSRRESRRMSAEELKSQFGSNKNIKSLLKVKDGLVRNVFYDDSIGKEVLIAGRPSDLGQISYAKRRGFDKNIIAQENDSRDNIILRGMGTTLHKVLELLIKDIDRQNEDFDIIKPDPRLGDYTSYLQAARAKIIANLSATVDPELKAIVEALNASGTYSTEQPEDQLLDPGSKVSLQKEDRIFSFDNNAFNELIDLAYKMYHNAYQLQGIMSWDSTKISKPVIRTESTVVDLEGEMMGSIDMLVFFDNGKVGHFDYKFISFAKQMSLEEGLSPEKIKAQAATYVRNPKTGQLMPNRKQIGLEYREEDVKGKFYSKKEAYEQQMRKYKEMVIKQYGLTPEDIVSSKVIPVNMVLQTEKTSTGGRKMLPKLQFIDHKDKLMREISVANELSGDAKLDDFINKLNKQLISLEILYKKKPGDIVLRDEIQALTENLNLLRTRRNIAGAAASMLSFANDLTTSLEMKEGETGYLLMSDLNRAHQILELYASLRDAARNEMERLRVILPETDYQNISTILDQQNSLSEYVLEEIIKERDRRILAFADEAESNEKKGIGRVALFEGYEISTSADTDILKKAGVGTSSRLSQLSDITYLGSMFSSLSEQQHPHLKLFKDIMDNVNNDVRDYVSKMMKGIKEATDELEKWASARGLTLYDAYAKIINPSTGNLITEYKSELYSTIKSMRENSELENLKDLIELDVEEYEKARERYRKSLERIHKTDTRRIDVKMKDFEKTYDMRVSDAAYVNGRNNMWKLKDDKKATWESDMWKYMKANAPLKKFYDYHISVMQSVQGMVGRDHDIRKNFVANVSKDMVDVFVQNGVFSAESMGDLWHSFAQFFKMRENDEDFGSVVDGQSIEDVPLMFTDALPGGNRTKSQDLGKSLLMMAYAAKLYSASKHVEGLAQGLKVSLASTKLFKTGAFGKDLTERMDNTEDSRTFKTLDGMIKMYLYGQNIQSGTEIVFGSKTATKKLNELMAYSSKLTLGWNYLSVIGGHLGAKAQIIQLASSGKYFDSKQHAKAERSFSANNKTAALLSEVFEVSSEGNAGLLHEKANTMTKSFLRNKWNKSLAYIWQRRSDDAIDNTILYAMSMNYYLHPNGVDVFPKNEADIYLKGTSYDIKDLKPIWELMSESDSADKVWSLPLSNGEGQITKTQFIKFRNKVKAVAGKAKGNYSKEDAYLYKTNMLMRMMMQYRGWIPAMVRERIGTSRYNTTLEEIERARFSTFFSEVTDALDGKVKRFLELSGTILADAATFGKFKFTKPNETSLKNSFSKWKQNNPLQYVEALKKYKSFANPEGEVFKEWKTATERELKELATEIRTYMIALAAMWILMFGAGDDEREDNPLIRTTVKIIDRVTMEIGFFFSPAEFLNIARRSPLPIVNLLGDSMNLIKNTTQETLDLLGGADSDKTISFVSPGDDPFSVEFGEQSKDPAGRGKYLYRMFPIARGLDGLLEVTEDPKNRSTFMEWLFGLDDETVYKK